MGGPRQILIIQGNLNADGGKMHVLGWLVGEACRHGQVSPPLENGEQMSPNAPSNNSLQMGYSTSCLTFNSEHGMGVALVHVITITREND